MRQLNDEHVTIITVAIGGDFAPLLQSLTLTQQEPDHLVVVDYEATDPRRDIVSKFFKHYTYALPSDSPNIARAETLGARLAPPKGWWCFVAPDLRFTPGWFERVAEKIDPTQPNYITSLVALTTEEASCADDLTRLAGTSPFISNPQGLLMMRAVDAMRLGGFDDEAVRPEAAAATMGDEYQRRTTDVIGKFYRLISGTCLLPEARERLSYDDDPVLMAKALLRSEGHHLAMPPVDREAIGPCVRIWSSEKAAETLAENTTW